jgi:hypothetical protein
MQNDKANIKSSVEINSIILQQEDRITSQRRLIFDL